MDGNSCPQWLAGLAWGVNSTIREHGALPIFREMLLAWMADMEAQERRLSDWEKRYGQYVEKVRKTPELRDSRAFHGNSVNGETDGGLKWFPLVDNAKDLWGWTPAEFRVRPETWPKPDIPLPLPAGRALTRPERYAALAAVHDLGCNGQEKVSPWPKPGDCPERQEERRYHLYQSLLDRVGELTEADLSALTAIWDETRREIESSKPNERAESDEQFFERISNEVHGLFFPLAPASNMALFRKRITEAIKRQRVREAEAEKETAAERFQLVRDNPELQDKEAGPPDTKSNWTWETVTDPETGETLEGWLHDNIRSVIPLSILRAETPAGSLPCLYLELALIHDLTEANREYKRKLPPRLKLLDGFDLPDEIAGETEGFYKLLLGDYSPGGLNGLSDARRRDIERALADVKADLAIERGEQAGGSGSLPAQGRKAAQAAPAENGNRRRNKCTTSLPKRGKRLSPTPRTDGYELFYSFSTKDESLRSKLETHLTMLKRDNLIREWNFREIPPGAHFENEIDKHLNTASIILLLVSADFLASEYCYTIEMERAMERHEEGSAVVIPIILRECDWHTAPFAGLEALPTDGKPVSSWREKDKAFTDIAKGIRRMIDRLKSEV